MLNKLVLYGLMAAVVACATAHAQPTPSSAGPARGTRAYTEAFYEQYQQAQAKYDALNADPNASLDALDAAHLQLRVLAVNAVAAAGDEAYTTYSDVRTAKEKYEAADAVYLKLQREGEKDKYKDYEGELKARDASLKAFREYLRAMSAGMDRIEKAIGIHIPTTDPPYTARHKALRDARAKANEEAAKKKADVEKKAQEQQNTEPKKTSCAPGGSLAGALENVACQEQHSGSGH